MGDVTTIGTAIGRGLTGFTKGLPTRADIQRQRSLEQSDLIQRQRLAQQNRSAAISEKRMELAQQSLKVQKARKNQSALSGLVDILDKLPPDSPFKELAVKAQLKQAGIKAEDPVMEKWVKALAKSKGNQRAFVLEGFWVRLKEDPALDVDAVARDAALNPAEFAKETIRLKKSQKQKAIMKRALQEGGEDGSTGQLKAGIKLLIEGGNLEGAAKLQKLLKDRVDRESAEAGEIRAAAKSKQDLAFGVTGEERAEEEAERKADAATQTSVLREIEISRKLSDLEQSEFNALYTDDAIGKREKGWALAILSGNPARMNRAVGGLIAAIDKDIKESKQKLKAITVRSIRDGNVVLAAGKEDEQGNITVMDDGNWRPLKDGEFKYTARGTVGEAGVTTAEKTKQQELGRTARGTFRELGTAVDMIRKSTNADFGLPGAIRKGLGVVTAPFKKKPLFKDFKNLQVQLDVIRATLAETFKADPRRFNENARKDAKALIPVAGELFETKGGAIKRLQVLQAFLASRLADVSEAGAPVGVSGLAPEDVTDLIGATPLTSAGAVRIILALFPKRFPK